MSGPVAGVWRTSTSYPLYDLDCIQARAFYTPSRESGGGPHAGPPGSRPACGPEVGWLLSTARGERMTTRPWLRTWATRTAA